MRLDPHDVRFADRMASGGGRLGVVGVPFDGYTAGRPGARFAPKKIREYFMGLRIPRGFEDRVVDFGDLPVTSIKPSEAHRTIYEALKHVYGRVEKTVVWGGDHTVTYPSFKAFSEGRKAGLVVLDAHHDIREPREPYLTSGVAMGLILDEGLVDPGHLVQVGLKMFADPPAYFEKAERLGVKTYMDVDVHVMGIDKLAEEILKTMEGRDVYLSIDMDVLEPAYAPGVNAALPGGLTWGEVVGIVSKLAPRVKAMDLVEVSPPYDVGDVTSKRAAYLTALYLTLTGQRVKSYTNHDNRKATDAL